MDWLGLALSTRQYECKAIVLCSLKFAVCLWNDSRATQRENELAVYVPLMISTPCTDIEHRLQCCNVGQHLCIESQAEEDDLGETSK